MKLNFIFKLTPTYYFQVERECTLATACKLQFTKKQVVYTRDLGTLKVQKKVLQEYRRRGAVLSFDTEPSPTSKNIGSITGTYRVRQQESIETQVPDNKSLTVCSGSSFQAFSDSAYILHDKTLRLGS